MSDLDLSKEVGAFLDDSPPAPGEPPETPPVEPPAEPPAEPPVEPGPPAEPPEPPAEPPVDVHPFEPPPAEPPPEEPPAEPLPPEEPLTEREKLLMDRLEIVTGERLDLEGALPPTPSPAEPAPPVVPPVAPVAPVAPLAAPAAPAEPVAPNFFGDMTLDDVIDDPEKFTKVMTNVAAHASTVAEKQAVEKVLKSIPQLVVNYVTRHATMSNLVSDFYKENSDLVDAKRTVAAVANEVAAENPQWDVAKVFTESATRTRKVLGLAARAAPPADPGAPVPPVPPVPPGKRPAFARQGSRGAPPGPALEGLAKEIDELITED